MYGATAAGGLGYYGDLRPQEDEQPTKPDTVVGKAFVGTGKAITTPVAAVVGAMQGIVEGAETGVATSHGFVDGLTAVPKAIAHGFVDGGKKGWTEGAKIDLS